MEDSDITESYYFCPLQAKTELRCKKKNNKNLLYLEALMILSIAEKFSKGRSQNTSAVHTFYFPSTLHIPHAIFIAANKVHLQLYLFK